LRFGTFSPPASHLASAAASWEEAVQARGPPLAVAHVPRLATALAAVVVAALTKAERAAPVVAAAAPVEAVAALA
jgi:hypothetical protein